MKTFLLTMVLGFASLPAQAQPTIAARIARGLRYEGQDMSPAVVLARVCLKEARFDSAAVDCAAIRVVLDRVGRGDVVLGAKLYSSSVFDPARLGNRGYLVYLNAAGTRPRLWPEHMRWDLPRIDNKGRPISGPTHREMWLELVGLCELWLQDDYRPCEPHHWGDHYGDKEFAESQGWEQVSCGVTQNLYWVNPRRRARELADR